jgi:hypothetical protein
MASTKSLTLSGLVFTEQPATWTSGAGTVTLTLTGSHFGIWHRTPEEVIAGVTPVNYVRPPGHVVRYGTNTTPGTTVMTTAMENARKVIDAKGGGAIVFDPEEYVWDGSLNLMVFTDCEGVVIEGNGAQVTNSRTNGTAAWLIQFVTCRNCEVRNLRLNGSNTTLTPSTGEGFVSILDQSKNIEVVNCEAYDSNTFVGVHDGTAPPAEDSRCSGVTVLNCYVEKTYYGIACSGDGDNVFVRNFKGVNTGRIYFPWNVKNHDVRVASEHGGPFDDVLLKVYCSSTWEVNYLKNIKLYYESPHRYASGTDQSLDNSLIAVSMQQWAATNTTAATFENIDIEFHVTGAATPNHERLIYMRRYTHAVAADATVRNHQFVNWKIRGTAVSCEHFNEDVISLFSTAAATWTNDNARNILFENVYLSGSSQIGIAVDCAPFDGKHSSLAFKNVIMDIDLNVTNRDGASPLSYDNVVANNFKITANAAYNPGTLGNGQAKTTTVICEGARFGDAAFASFSNDLQGTDLQAWISDADTVSVRFRNLTGAAIDLPSGTLRVWTRPS